MHVARGAYALVAVQTLTGMPPRSQPEKRR